jgi:membrane protein DedA with SNARE-associated domain
VSSLVYKRHLESELTGAGALSPRGIGYGVVAAAASFEAERSMHHIFSPSGMTEWVSRWGYLGIFICVFVGNLGLPLPEELVLLAAGFLAGRHTLQLGTLYIVAIVSAVTGDCCGFVIGRTGGQRLFEWLSEKSQLLHRRYKRLQTFFLWHGNQAVFFARFITGARFMAGPMAGAAGMRFRSFLGWDLLGAFIWCTVMITIGYFVGNQLEWVAHAVHKGGQWIAAAGLLVVTAMWLFWRYRRHRTGSEA